MTQHFAMHFAPTRVFLVLTNSSQNRRFYFDASDLGVGMLARKSLSLIRVCVMTPCLNVGHRSGRVRRGEVRTIVAKAFAP